MIKCDCGHWSHCCYLEDDGFYKICDKYHDLRKEAEEKANAVADDSDTAPGKLHDPNISG